MRTQITEMLIAARKHIAVVEHQSPSTEIAVDQALGAYIELASAVDAMEDLQKYCKTILMNIAVETGTTTFEGSTARSYTTKPGTTVRADVKALQSLAIRRPDIAAEINQCLEVKPTGGRVYHCAEERLMCYQLASQGSCALESGKDRLHDHSNHCLHSRAPDGGKPEDNSYYWSDHRCSASHLSCLTSLALVVEHRGYGQR